MVAHESGESDRDKALRIKEERRKEVESPEEELEPSGAAASAAPVGIEEEEGVKEEESLCPNNLCQQSPPKRQIQPQIPLQRSIRPQRPKRKRNKKWKDHRRRKSLSKIQQSTQQLTQKADPADRRPGIQGGRIIADVVASQEGVQTGWEVRGTDTKFTPTKAYPEAPWRKQVKKQIWGQAKSAKVRIQTPKQGFAAISEAQGSGQAAKETGCCHRRPEEAHQRFWQGAPKAGDQA